MFSGEHEVRPYCSVTGDSPVCGSDISSSSLCAFVVKCFWATTQGRPYCSVTGHWPVCVDPDEVRDGVCDNL